MTYDKHVILNGLDEARRHQRGENVGTEFVSSEPDKPRHRGRSPLTEKERHDIAFSRLPYDDLAAMYNVSKATIAACRREYGTARALNKLKRN